MEYVVPKARMEEMEREFLAHGGEITPDGRHIIHLKKEDLPLNIEKLWRRK
jgi:hypothetical protein